MLALKNITKDYVTGDTVVHALKGVDIGFRANEFVSVLGASGCGKTTLLNIVGGLDRYTSGDLVINGRSTTSFGDADWDAYRNHSIGFVFQSYNLIPHQTVLTNVELALTISGVSKAERRKRAADALTRVGLGDMMNKKPNQMSGGQMQRVAIARAIVNDPEILLADEPTGALDTATSVQIMDILKEIAKDRLVVMVTHNPDLAEQYSTRIIRLKDGLVTDDSDPYPVEEAAAPVRKQQKKKKALSMKTALSLSLNNLMTKKTRTFLTSFAGSIGIIGIALILSLSSGIKAYINDVQEDALSSYPIMLQQETQDYTAMFEAMTEAKEDASRQIVKGEKEIFVDDSLVNMLSAMMSTTKNDLKAFKAHLDAHKEELKDCITDIRYTYNFNMQIYSSDGTTRINPTTLVDNMGDSISGMIGMMSQNNSLYESSYASIMNIFQEMLDNTELVQSQYDVVAGEWAYDAHDVMLVVNKNNALTNLVLYVLGLKDQAELSDMVTMVLSGEKPDFEYDDYTYDDFLGMQFYIIPNSEFFVKTGKTYESDGVSYPIWEDVRERKDFDQQSFVANCENKVALNIKGIIRPNPDAVSTSITGSIAYNGSLTKEIMELVRKSEIAKQQTEGTPAYDVLSGLPFDDGRYNNLEEAKKAKLFSAFISSRTNKKAELMLAILASSTDELVASRLGLMTAEEKQQYVASNFFSLADLAPEQFKPLMLTLMQMTMGEKYAEVGPMMEAMEPEQFAEMLRAQGALDPATLDDQTVAGLTMFLAALPEEQTDLLAGAILKKELSDGAIEELLAQYTTAQLAEMFDEAFAQMTTEQKAVLFDANVKEMLSETTFDRRTVDLGFVDEESPASISLYAKDFDGKEVLTDFIDNYNKEMGEEKEIRYTDIVGLMLTSVTAILDAISYVLIAFVSISLVVSSIMIGIITYISVLERTKEIGILRAIGASKHDISKVFNAETLIVGFCAGAIGILATILLCLPINALIHYFSGIYSINAVLPVAGGIILVVISMFLTFFAGLIPAKIAAKKDPVTALRTE